MTTVGGTILGNCSTGSMTEATAPARRMTSEMTQAKIGRSMKKWDRFIVLAAEPCSAQFYNCGSVNVLLYSISPTPPPARYSGAKAGMERSAMTVGTLNRPSLHSVSFRLLSWRLLLRTPALFFAHRSALEWSMLAGSL